MKSLRTAKHGWVFASEQDVADALRYRRARDEGVERGRVEGERAVLERLLRRRFGELPRGTAERLGRASAADLETWAENVLGAESLADVFD